MSQPNSAFLRGVSLRQLRNFEEAAAYFREALAGDPENAEAHLQLALCLDEIEGQRKEALAAVDRAIAIEPEEPVFHIVRSSILAQLHKGSAALEAANAALALAPDSPQSYVAVARAELARERWADSETAARAALALDGDDESAQGILAVALRMQGKSEEDEIAVGRLLSENPEDEYAHLNAGYSALRRFDHKQAEEHFRESLRLDASFEPAREGLVESFRARSRFYRVYQRYCFWMQRFTQGNRWMLIIGIYLAFRFGRVALAAIHPSLAVLLVVLYLTFIFWIWLARGIGNFMIFCDRSARLALKSSERLEALFVGGGFALGLALALLSIAVGGLPLAFAGGALAIGALPASMVFTNASKAGRAVFGSVLALVYVGGFGSAISIALDSPLSPMFSDIAICALIGTMLCTWLGNVSALRQ